MVILFTVTVLQCVTVNGFVFKQQELSAVQQILL